MATLRAHLSSVLDRLSRLVAELSARDLATFGRLLAPLQEISRTEQLPPAMATQAKRLAGLLEKAVMGDTSAEGAIPKLAEGIEKMTRAFEGLPPGPLDDELGTQSVPEVPKASSPPPAPRPVLEIIPAIDAESLQLRARFAANQLTMLEDFEVAILEQEKGNPAGTDFVKRHLHTLKGEFGVLDLPMWADLIHDIETGLEEKSLGVEVLLRFKDILQDRLPSIAAGQNALNPEEVASFLCPVKAPGTSPLGQSTASDLPEESVHGDETTAPTDYASVLSNDTSFLIDFIAEGGDHIHSIEKSLLRLETCPTDEESLNLVFRSCHTIKGLAGFLELSEIQTLAHAAETLMDKARNHELTLRPQHVDLLLAVTDCFKALINGLESVLSGEEASAPGNIDELIAQLRSPDTLNPMPVLPPEQAHSRLGEILVEKGIVDQDSVVSALDLQSQGDTRQLGEILVDQGNASAREIAQSLGSQIETRRPVAAATAQPGQTAVVEETIRVPVQRLDLLIDAIGEAVIAQSMAWADPAIRQVSDLGLEKKIAQASLMMRQIQELSMSLRMVSIRSTFQKMTRLVRDLSRKLDKQIEMVMEGEETELDKTVVENIGDPLIHMVRNSLDHGIEMPADRVAAGKPAQGTLHLRAYHKAGNVYIEIQDDGKGLDREAILRKSIDSGAAKADQHYTDAEVYQMIFAPGLSTAKAVTDISGRGVGMDVVKKNIEALRGTIEISSEKGKGSKFTIRLPLTLAIINGMVVRVEQERYIVPTLSILATIMPEASQLQTVVGRGEFLNLRGELIRLIRLKEVFGKARSRHGVLEQEFQVVLIVEDTVGRKVGILVDEILDQQQVVIKNLGTALGEVMGVSGGAIMNDGSVSLIVDVGGIVKAASE